MWTVPGILAALIDGLREADQRLTDEQAVYGLDAADEVGLHPVLASGLHSAGYGVHREVLYPGEHTAPVRRSARNRCDLVVVPEPGQALADPAVEQAALLAAEDTLFGGVAHEMAGSAPAVSASEAFWLEIKTVSQHAQGEAVMTRRGYADRLVKGPAADLVKLAKDPSIWFGGVAMVLFAESESVARHDLAAMAHRCLDAELPVAGIELGGTRIQDRAGNAWCGVGLLALRSGG